MPADYVRLSKALDVQVERPGVAWNIVPHLHAVADTPALRASYLTCLPQVTAFYTALHGDASLYRKYRAISEGPGLSPAQARAVALAVQSAQLAGAELTGQRKQPFADIAERRAIQPTTALTRGPCRTLETPCHMGFTACRKQSAIEPETRMDAGSGPLHIQVCPYSYPYTAWP